MPADRRLGRTRAAYRTGRFTRTVAVHFVARNCIEFPREFAITSQAQRLLKGIPASALSLARKGSTVLCPTQTSDRNRLIEKHLRNVKAAARRLRIYGPLHDEIVSAGYEALVRAGDRFDPTMNVTFTTFAFRPVLGSMYDHLKTHARWAANHVDIDSEKGELAAPASAERQTLTAQVLAAVESLPSLPRNLIKAHFLEEESLSSISARLGLSKTRVSIHLGRALQLLREKLDDGFVKWPVREPTIRRRFSEEFKSTAIRQASQPGTNVAQLARDLDISAATIHTWLRTIRQQANRALPLAA